MSRKVEHFAQGLTALVIILILLAAYSRGEITPSGNLFALTPSTATVITTATTTSVKGTAGTLRRIVVGTGVASATIKLFNVAAASCTGTPGSGAAGVITLPSTLTNPFTLEYQTSFSAGICVVTSGATNVTVVSD